MTGRDVTPENTCGGCAERQIHVSGAVAFGIRQYFSLTRDEGFLKDQYYKVFTWKSFVVMYYSCGCFLVFLLPHTSKMTHKLICLKLVCKWCCLAL